MTSKRAVPTSEMIKHVTVPAQQRQVSYGAVLFVSVDVVYDQDARLDLPATSRTLDPLTDLHLQAHSKTPATQRAEVVSEDTAGGLPDQGSTPVTWDDPTSDMSQRLVVTPARAISGC